ncbi:GntR family transcriptional regulator [Actinophytocola sp.]|uniref:GntR family transcriptional regulator n=1 Tax=Actinophytocola sp. TaxID=1872138 RepID=UPI003D6AD5C3
MTTGKPPIELTRTVAPIRTQVADLLRKMIMDGTFAPGERLVERVLCDMMGASRSTLREALRKLETEGLVTVKPGQGPAVAEVDEKGIRDLYAVREALEQLAITLFLKNVTEDGLADLERAFEVLKAAHATGDVSLAMREKQAFYRALFAIAGNDVISDVADKLYARTTSVRLLSYSHAGRLGEGLRELELVMTAIRRGDGPAAMEAYAAHMAKAMEAAVQSLKTKQP